MFLCETERSSHRVFLVVVKRACAREHECERLQCVLLCVYDQIHTCMWIGRGRARMAFGQSCAEQRQGVRQRLRMNVLAVCDAYVFLCPRVCVHGSRVRLVEHQKW